MALTHRHVTIPGALMALAIVPSIAGVARLWELSAGQPAPSDVRFFDAPVPIVLHILMVVPYAVLGALQFAPALRRRGWHRTTGLLLVPTGLGVGLSGLWMTLTYPWPPGDGAAVYVMRLAVGAAMIVSILAGIATIRRRDYAAHGAWMTRGYALGMGAGTQVLTHLPWFILVGTPGERSRAVMMGLGWLINLAAAEYAIARGALLTTGVRRAERRPLPAHLVRSGS